MFICHAERCGFEGLVAQLRSVIFWRGSDNSLVSDLGHFQILVNYCKRMMIATFAQYSSRVSNNDKIIQTIIILV